MGAHGAPAVKRGTKKQAAKAAKRKQGEHFFEQVPGCCNFTEFYTFAADVLAGKKAPVIVAELGVFHGQSTAFLGVELERRQIDWEIVGVDNFVAVSEAQVAKNLASLGSRVKLMKADTREAPSLPDGCFDMVFFDACSGYFKVCQELNAWLPKIRKGGMAAGHGYMAEQDGLMRAVNERFSTFGVIVGTKAIDGQYMPVWYAYR
jgi:hypothetical protein